MGNPKLDLKATFSGEGAGQALSLCYEDVTHPGVQSPDRKEAVSTNSQLPRVAVVGRRGRAKLKEARLDKAHTLCAFQASGAYSRGAGASKQNLITQTQIFMGYFLTYQMLSHTFLN